jgi:hypothetical protein
MHHTSVPETRPLAWHLYWANRLLHFALDDTPFTRWGMMGVLPSALHSLMANPEQLIQEAMAQVKSVENLLR